MLEMIAGCTSGFASGDGRKSKYMLQSATKN